MDWGFINSFINKPARPTIRLGLINGNYRVPLLFYGGLAGAINSGGEVKGPLRASLPPNFVIKVKSQMLESEILMLMIVIQIRSRMQF